MYGKQLSLWWRAKYQNCLWCFSEANNLSLSSSVVCRASGYASGISVILSMNEYSAGNLQLKLSDKKTNNGTEFSNFKYHENPKNSL